MQQISHGKFDRLQRTTAGFTDTRLDGYGLCCSLPTCPRVQASYPILVHRHTPLLHASFRPRLATTPLRFANPSPPSGWIGDLHPNNYRTCTAHNDRMMESWEKQKAAFPTFPHPLEIFQISTFPSLDCCSENTKSIRTANLNQRLKCQPRARSKVSTISPAAHSTVPTGLNEEGSSHADSKAHS